MRLTGWVFLTGGLAWPCHAQTRPAHARGEEPTIVLGLTAGYLFKSFLFDIGNQPYQPSQYSAAEIDTIAIRRETRFSTTFTASITYFPVSHLGLTGEAGFLGLGADTQCKFKGGPASDETDYLCQRLTEARTQASAMMIAVGGIYRAFSRSGFSPFASVKVGAMLAADNPDRLYAIYLIEDRKVLLRLYDDERKTASSWYAQAAAGFSVLLAPGYRVRLEARDNILHLPIPAGPSEPDRSIYPKTTVVKHLLSVNFGFDVVLQAKPGRRY